MVDIVTQNTSSREVWIQQLAEAITNPDELLQILNLENHLLSKKAVRHVNYFLYAFQCPLFPV